MTSNRRQKWFKSATMWFCSAAFMFTVSSSLVVLVYGECHAYEKDYYTDIGCVPEAEDEHGCPTSYDCSALARRSQDKCYYQSKAYDGGHTLAETPDSPCKVLCRCQSAANNSMAFSCVHVECPSDFGVRPGPGCYNSHEHGHCCSVKEICDSGEAEGKTPKDVCEYKGKTYRVGEKFYPDESPCLTCICGPNFVGQLEEPFCRKINCSVELTSPERILEGCVPVYYGNNSCCPHSWRCPDESDSVIPSESNTGSKSVTESDKTCRFGSLTLRVGDSLNPVNEGGEWQCSCRVPPHPICIETPQSYDE